MTLERSLRRSTLQHVYPAETSPRWTPRPRASRTRLLSTACSVSGRSNGVPLSLGRDPVAAAEIAAATTGGDFAELTTKSGTTFQRILARYTDVNIRTKPSKVFRLLLNAGWAWGSPR